ncbi:SRPBCC family protein [Neomicrococcus lactis]|uniref:SRPBCC family protein n=1 Tax=Neomicrococcus lactis TaxID=732241 RepID=UPI00230018CE|nr:SRPBCC family protein [Neomicrococcus lactis]
MSWSHSSVVTLPVAMADVWEVIATPEVLPAWNPAVSKLERQEKSGRRLVPGDRLDFVPQPPFMGAVHSATAPPAVVTEFRLERAFEWRQPQPGGGMTVRWDLEAVPAGTQITQTVTLTGLGARVFAETNGKPFAANFERNAHMILGLEDQAHAYRH